MCRKPRWHEPLADRATSLILPHPILLNPHLDGWGLSFEGVRVEPSWRKRKARWVEVDGGFRPAIDHRTDGEDGPGNGGVGIGRRSKVAQAGVGLGQAQDPIGNRNVQSQNQLSDEINSVDREEAAVAILPLDQNAPGLHLMTRGDLEAAVGNYDPGRAGDWDETGTSSREDAVRLRLLSRYRDDPDLTWRRHLVADDHMLTRLGRLAAGAGNMVQAIEVVRRAALISRHTGTPLKVPPLVLVGPAGTGKSRCAGLLAEAIGTSSRTIAGTSLQDVGPLVGYGAAWRGAGEGLVAKALLACKTAAPVVVVDEAEKVRLSSDARETPLDCLLPILEPTTGAAFRDNYLDVPMRAENIIWLFCANSLDGLSPPLLDRCVVIEVAELSGDARRTALAELVTDVVLDYGVAPADLDDDTLTILDAIGMRRARAVVTAALAGALEGGRDWPTAADFQVAAALLGGEAVRPRRRAAGFVHF